MYDAVIVEALECALSKASTDYLNSEDIEDREKSGDILCKIVDRAEKLVSIQDERTREEEKLEVVRTKDKAELELKWQQFKESIAKDNTELEIKKKQLDYDKAKDKEELELKWQQFKESIVNNNKEFELKLEAIKTEAEKMKAQKTIDIWKYIVSTTVSVGTIFTAFWFDGKGNMFTSTKGKKIVDDGSNLRNFYK